MASETTTDIKDAEGNPFAEESQSAFADGLMQIFKPAVEELDDKVVSVRQSQVELREQIDKLAQDLHRLSELQELPIDLEPYVKKLMNSRRRVMLVNTILQNAQEKISTIGTFCDVYHKAPASNLHTILNIISSLAGEKERLGRLHQSVTRETAKRKALLEPSEF